MADVPVRILLFAHPRELLGGAPFVDVRLPAGTTLRDARAALGALPALAAVVGACAFALGDALVPLSAEATTLCGAEVALIPPVSGG